MSGAIEEIVSDHDHGADSPCLLKESCLFKSSGLFESGNTSLSYKEVLFIKYMFWTMAALIVFLVGAYSFIQLYPFKTIVFTESIQVLNTPKTYIVDGKEVLVPQVPLGGTVNMRIYYKKYTNEKALIIRTLARRRGRELIVLDSSTVVSNRLAGEGVTESFYYTPMNPEAVGPDCVVIYSIFYTLFGHRSIIKQFESVPFEIYAPAQGK